jgi:LuxR family maltose regulon positive regulatory protein
VLDLLALGLPNKAIARELDVSGETVKWHIKNLFSKLSAGSRRHVVERARMLGLVAN